MQCASLIKCFSACLYEALALIAIWLFMTFLFMLLFGDVDTIVKQLSLQFFLWAVTGLYLILCWVKTGQTLAMQAWKIKLVNTGNKCLSIKHAIFRYIMVTMSLSFFGAGFLWALVDKKNLFLHDRLLKTRLVQLVKD